MYSDVSIKAIKLSKSYQIYRQPRDRLKQLILPQVQKLLGIRSKQYYQEFWALRDVSFEIKAGETVGIVGSNGSGKSTLLQMICGTINPTTGTIKTKGRIAALLELGSGFNPEFTGRENVYLNGIVLGISRKEVDSLFDDIVEFADIGGFIDQPLKNYSSGMIVRLAFAVQAMINADILIIDEALAVGDEKFQRKCFDRIEILKSRGTSILFVSHSAAQIVELCDRAILLNHGVQVLEGDPVQVVRAYQELIYVGKVTPRPSDKNAISVERLQSNFLQSNAEQEKLREMSSSDTYDQSLVPATSLAYPEQGAEILTLDIFDSTGQKCNLLTLGENYQFKVTGHFSVAASDVYFGIHIRSVMGSVISGQRYPEGDVKIPNIDANKSFALTYIFKMILLPGTYFVGAGIWSLSEPTCRHRVIDSIMFRVISVANSNSFGLVDACAAAPIFDLT